MKTNKTVLVTGASSGIGYALCKEFAKEDYTIVAIGRNAQALEQLKQACHNTKVYCLSKDLTDADAVETILDFLHNNQLTVTTLVNNAAVGIWGDFINVDIHQELHLVTLSILFYLQLTKALLPAMIKQKQGTILNIGSVYSFTAVPNQSVYAACKAFLLSHTLSLRNELNAYQVNVSICCPGMTKTAFHKNRKASSVESVFAMSPEQVAEITLAGLKKNKSIIIPGMLNKLFFGLCKFFPMNLMSRFIYRVNLSRKVHKKG